MPAEKKGTQQRKRVASGRSPEAGKTHGRSTISPLQKQKQTFPIVGIGASAGALDAFEAFFSNMPPDSGMAFVLVPHLDLTHVSLMPEVLTKYTKMEILVVKDGLTVTPNRVYIIPTNSVFEDFEVGHDFPEIGHKKMLLNGRGIFQQDIGTEMILLAMEEVRENRNENIFQIRSARREPACRGSASEVLEGRKP